MSTESGFMQPSFPKFYDHYNDHWCMLMENFMRSKEYWSIIEEGIPDVAIAATGVQLTDKQKEDVDDDVRS
ncbi:hypothetical protein M5689_020492 [Euphorbia peplus]|nr:hypothetical protein M5689_020492 [Euphorbia peplus]